MLSALIGLFVLINYLVVFIPQMMEAFIYLVVEVIEHIAIDVIRYLVEMALRWWWPL